MTTLDAAAVEAAPDGEGVAWDERGAEAYRDLHGEPGALHQVPHATRHGQGVLVGPPHGVASVVRAG